VKYDDINVDVHGGLTYSREEEELWVIGFDCAHSMDFTPGYSWATTLSQRSNYKTIEYVKQQVESYSPLEMLASTTTEKRSKKQKT
jgi:hypothetical protein